MSNEDGADNTNPDAANPNAGALEETLSSIMSGSNFSGSPEDVKEHLKESFAQMLDAFEDQPEVQESIAETLVAFAKGMGGEIDFDAPTPEESPESEAEDNVEFRTLFVADSLEDKRLYELFDDVGLMWQGLWDRTQRHHRSVTFNTTDRCIEVDLVRDPNLESRFLMVSGPGANELTERLVRAHPDIVSSQDVLDAAVDEDRPLFERFAAMRRIAFCANETDIHSRARALEKMRESDESILRWVSACVAYSGEEDAFDNAAEFYLEDADPRIRRLFDTQGAPQITADSATESRFVGSDLKSLDRFHFAAWQAELSPLSEVEATPDSPRQSIWATPDFDTLVAWIDDESIGTHYLAVFGSPECVEELDLEFWNAAEYLERLGTEDWNAAIRSVAILSPVFDDEDFATFLQALPAATDLSHDAHLALVRLAASCPHPELGRRLVEALDESDSPQLWTQTRQVLSMDPCYEDALEASGASARAFAVTTFAGDEEADLSKLSYQASRFGWPFDDAVFDDVEDRYEFVRFRTQDSATLIEATFPESPYIPEVSILGPEADDVARRLRNAGFETI